MYMFVEYDPAEGNGKFCVRLLLRACLSSTPPAAFFPSSRTDD